LRNYQEIEKTCKKNSEITKSLIDDFLIHYCVQREGLDKIFAKKLSKFRSIVKIMPEEWPFWLLSQHVAFRLFRKDGFINQYMKHPNIISRSNDEKSFLSYQIQNPWKYSFCSVRSNPSRHFFEMTDVLSNDNFLLYSPGVTDILEKNGSIQMFFYLLGFNGHCYQTYGPHTYLKGIIPSDLLFFARELNPEIVFMNEIPDLIDRDPLPWLMLFRGAEIPLSVHKNDFLLLNSSEYHEENFEPDKYEQFFKIERKYPLYKLSLKHWNKFPHFAASYYHKKKNRLILSSLTNRGYSKLIEAFNKMGYNLPVNPENRVTLTMLSLVKDILGIDIQLNPYEKSFSKPVNQEHSEELEKINIFLRSFMEAHNAGKAIDIEKLAAKAGIDPETAQSVANEALRVINKQ